MLDTITHVKVVGVTLMRVIGVMMIMLAQPPVVVGVTLLRFIGVIRLSPLWWLRSASTSCQLRTVSRVHIVCRPHDTVNGNGGLVINIPAAAAHQAV